jgi:hypothetical protein
MKPLLALLVAVLLLAGCGGMTTSAPTPPPSARPSPGFTVPTRLFASAVLGISFRYPAAWRLWTHGVVLRRAEGQEDGTVAFHASTGEVGVVVDLIRPTRHAAPYAFGAADSSDLASRRSSTGDSIVSSSLVTLDGLRLAEIEQVGKRAPGVASWHFLELSSAGMGGDLATLDHSLLLLYVACPANLWKAQRATLLAVLSSVRISKPKG